MDRVIDARDLPHPSFLHPAWKAWLGWCMYCGKETHVDAALVFSFVGSLQVGPFCSVTCMRTYKRLEAKRFREEAAAAEFKEGTA